MNNLHPLRCLGPNHLFTRRHPPLFDRATDRPARAARSIFECLSPPSNRGVGEPVRWKNLPSDEPYLWDHLVYHLNQAELRDELYTTVTDLCYLAAKSFARSETAAEADLRTTLIHFFDDAQLHSLNHHFANAVHLLGRGETLQDLHVILYSRLHHVEALQPACETLLEGLSSPYLLPNHPLPDLPRPGLIRTLSGHTDGVNGCAYSPDGRYILSASFDKTLKVWQAETGGCLATLAVEGALIDCTWLPDGVGVAAVGAGGVYFFKVIV